MIHASGRQPLCYELTCDPVGSDHARMQEAASEAGLRKFLSTAPKPLGVLGLNDDFARCVCVACQALGLAIPDEVAVLGVDDTSVARLNVPPLSSIRPPGERVGYEAMKLLDRIMCRGAIPAAPILIPCDAIGVRESTQRIADASIERALRLIQVEACQGLTVGSLVRFLGVGRSSFEKRFTQQIGRTPGQELQRVKLHQARKLLAETELSVTRIAGMVGFARSSIFGAFFKKYAGMTPTEYRRQRGSGMPAGDEADQSFLCSGLAAPDPGLRT